MSPTTARSNPQTISGTEFIAVKHRLAELNSMIEELKRKSRGTTAANAKVARLEAQVKTISDQLKLAGQRYNTADGDPAIKASAAGQVWALDSRLTELYSDLNGRITAVEGAVGEHAGLLAEHGTSIGMLNEGHQSLNRRVSSISMESARTPWWQFIVAASAGIIAGILWSNHVFMGSILRPDGQVVDYPLSAANSGWSAIIAGIAVAAIVLGVLSFFTNNRKTAQVNTTMTDERRETITTPVVVRPVPFRKSIRATDSPREPIADPAPTQVITTEPGVPTGARS